MLFIYTNAIMSLVLFILIQVQSVFKSIERKENKESISGTIVALLMYILSLYTIAVNLFRYNDIIIYKFLQISCISYFIISTVYIFFKNIILKKTKYKIMKFVNVLIVVEQVFITIALRWGLK